MVYCEFKSDTNDSVVYTYGATIDDMTGEISYNFKDDVLEIIKKPEKYGVMTRHLNRIMSKHRKEFQHGKFEEKLAYEA